MGILTYSELIKFESFDERLDYLKLWNVPHTSPRSISESFYKSKAWREVREFIIRRDLGCDLGKFGVYIYGSIYVHHVNPITEEDIVQWSDSLIDPENLISTSLTTHNFIHYKPDDKVPYVERQPNDTKLW